MLQFKFNEASFGKNLAETGGIEAILIRKFGIRFNPSYIPILAFVDRIVKRET